MTHAFTQMHQSLRRRIAYRRTAAELQALPLRSRLDLDIAGIETLVAHRAVYGF